MNIDFTIIISYLPQVLLGAMWTIIITFTSVVFSIILGVLLAIILLYAPKVIRKLFGMVSYIFMGTPLLLQLFLVYFGLVEIGIDLPAIVAGIITLSIHFAVYNSDVIQAGILAIDKGQNEGARTMGLSNLQTLRYIIVPQALRDMLPSISNNMIALLKDSALVSIIGVSELVLSSQKAISETYHPFEFYILIAALYYIINLFMEYGLKRIEIRAAMSK